MAIESNSNWNSLSHPERMRRAYELGVDFGREETRAREAIDGLAAGSSFERRIALQTVYGSHDGELAARLSSDQHRSVRRSALKLLAMFGTPQQLEPVFLASNESAQRGILRVLVKYQRREVIDRLCTVLRDAGGDWQVLAPYASVEFLEKQFESAFERAGYSEWMRLTRQHPRYALEKLLDRAKAATELDRELINHSNAALHALEEREPDLALDLVREVLRHTTIDEIKFGDLLPQRPEAIAQLVLSRDDKCSLSFSTYAHRLQPETLRQLLLKRSNTLTYPTRWLKRLPHEQRGALWSEFGMGWRGQDGTVDLELILLLPRAAREKEAQRHIKLFSLSAKPEKWMRYATALDHGELLEKVAPFTGDPDPDLRVVAHSTLAANVRLARQFVDELLERVRQRGNEQDPVRNAMLNGLADLPPSIWRADHLETLATIQRQALDARDLSQSSANALERLLIRILPSFPEWTTGQWSVLIKERGQISFWALERYVTNEQMKVVGPALLPVFQDWVLRERSQFIAAMGSLRKRLKVWDEGAKLLADFAKNGPSSLAPSAILVLAEHRRDVFRELVPQLLKMNESWGVQRAVMNFIHFQRQDLWTPALLGREKIKGCYWTGKTRYVLPLRNGFGRWNPEQQEMWAVTLREVINDSQRDTPAAISAIEKLAELPDIVPNKLLALASLDNEKAVTREAALRVLSRLDGGQGVPLMVEALDDERARIAIYSLRRAIMEMPQDRALGILRTTPLQRVTVAKEVIRLLGDLKTAPAFELILDFAAQKLHRDVRIALLRSLWEHLEEDRVWPILNEAANSEDSAIARMAARTTSARMSVKTMRRLNDLRARLLAHPESRVRMEVLQTLQLGATDPDRQLRAPIFGSLQSKLPAEYSAAAQAIWAVYGGGESALVQEAITQLLPRRYALKSVVEEFGNRAQWSRTQYKDLGQALLSGLEGDPTLLGLRLDLAFKLLRENQFSRLVENELKQGHLHFEVLHGLVSLIETSYAWGDNADFLQDLKKRWQKSESPELRRLALAVLRNKSRDSKGWTRERRHELKMFREDSSPMVASAAIFTFPLGANDEVIEAEDEV